TRLVSDWSSDVCSSDLGVSLVLFVLALRHLGSARTGAYFSTAPFIGALLGIAMFGEAVTTQLVLAAVLMGIGLYLHLAEHHEHRSEERRVGKAAEGGRT